MIAVKGLPQRAGLPFRASPAPCDAAVVKRFRAAGWHVEGVTVTDGAGFGTMTEWVANPRHPRRAVGGSSGGSAAAVAGGLAELALGTDTGGSVRIPAAYCDLAAYKPSTGRVPMEGVLPLSQSFDVVGLLAPDLAALGNAAPVLVPDWQPVPPSPHSILLDPDTLAVCEPEVRTAFKAVTARWSPVETALPAYEPMAMAHSTIVCAEGLEVHRADWQRHRAAFPPIVAGALAYAETLEPDAVDAAYAAARAAREEIAAVLAGGGILISPTLPIVPADRHAATVRLGGADVPVTNANIRLTLMHNVAGLPVVVLPIEGVSIQFAAAAGQDEALMAAVEALVKGKA